MKVDGDANGTAVCKGSVLLVDDDVLVLESMALLLEDECYAVTRATSGHRAIDLYRQWNFEVVISDVHMPGMNGIELLRAIKAADPRVRTMAVTGRIDDLDALLEVDDYLFKPLDDRVFVERVARSVEHFRSAAPILP